MSFVNLHVHTHYSLLDGHSKPDEAARRAAELGQSALAITDHDSLGGALKMYDACRENQIKPIIGLEAYVAPHDRLSKEVVRWGTPEQRADDISGGGKYTHITLFAQTASGLRNLYRLHGVSYSEGFYLKPRIDTQSLSSFNGGIVATTGCPSGAVQTRLRLGQYAEAKQAAGDLLDIFTRDRLYVEIMDHGIEIERRVREDLLRIARELNIPLLATSDSHFTHESESDIHDTLLCIQTKAKKSDKDRFRFNGHGYYLRSAAEMDQLFSGVEGAVRNTVRVANQVEDYSEVFAHRLRMPTLTADDGWELTIRAIEGLGDILEGKPEEEVHPYWERLHYELSIINALEYPGYFLVLADLLQMGRDEGIRFGPGRGSASGSLVGYAMQITGVDPISEGLIFERFLNPERVSLPDIDVDVDDAKRDYFLSLVRNRIGANKVAQVGTFGTIKARNAIKDSVRALGHPYAMGTSLVAKLPPAKAGRSPSVSELPETTSNKEIRDTALGIEGTIRSKGVHASAVVITTEDDLLDQLPLWNPRKDGKPKPATTIFDGEDVENLGFIKFDFLGLATLGVIDECLQLLNNGSGRPAPLKELPRTFNDQATFGLLAAAETTGVFQLDGHGMRTLLRRLKPTSLNDIAAVLALYRPGPMGANAHTEYADRKSGRSRVRYPHPEFEDSLATILSPTFGIIVFQEQLIAAVRAVTGFSLGRADILRKACGKKDAELLAEQERPFKESALANGFSREAVDALWDVIVPFADYSFPKAHAVAYAYISYWTAYLKTHHPAEYFCSLLSKEEDPDTLHQYIHEATRRGVSVLPPDINESKLGWTLTATGIRFGCAAIKGVSQRSYAALARERPYVSIEDFFRRADPKVLNLGVLKAAIKCGAFDSIEPNREQLLADAEGLAARAIEDRELAAKGQTRLWQSYSVRSGKRSLGQRQEWEEAVLGVALTCRRVRLKLRRRVSENELYYIRQVVQDYPGNQPLDLEVSSLTVLKDLGTINLKPAAVDRLNLLGSVEVEEEE